MHSAGTTVREALLFSARLRLTEDITLPQASQRYKPCIVVRSLLSEPVRLPLAEVTRRRLCCERLCCCALLVVAEAGRLQERALLWRLGITPAI